MKVLIIAPHPDDEILGIGGTIAKRSNLGDEVCVCIITKGYKPLFSELFIEQGRKEAKEADRILGVKDTIFLDFPAVMLETVPRYELNQKISDVIQKVKPDDIYIPHRGDMQLDHQLVTDAAMVALRPKYSHVVKRIYVYETLSETGWNIPNVQNEFLPNAYVNISKFLERKLDAMKIYKSQLNSFPETRSIEALEALARYRGAIMGMEAAEAFMLIREIDL